MFIPIKTSIFVAIFTDLNKLNDKLLIKNLRKIKKNYLLARMHSSFFSILLLTDPLFSTKYFRMIDSSAWASFFDLLSFESNLDNLPLKIR